VLVLGKTAVMEVSETTTTLVAATPATVTPLVPLKPVPVIVTGVATSTGALLGLTPLMVGATS
jgi:hypothetical protein